MRANDLWFLVFSAVDSTLGGEAAGRVAQAAEDQFNRERADQDALDTVALDRRLAELGARQQ